MSSAMPAYLDQEAVKEIRTRSCPKCYLCGSLGVPHYQGLKDFVFGAPGTWDFKRCPNPMCHLVWLDPVPIEEDIGNAYAKYYTHGELLEKQTGIVKLLRRCASVLFSLVNPVHGEGERLSLMYLNERKPGKVLDVGCGNGARLARLRSIGWAVYGQEVDPKAISHARETFGVEARLGRLEDVGYEPGSFDCITLHHVIEHAHDPLALLRQTRHLLKSDGLLVVVTPNASSFASRRFGRYWRGLEPPRHIHLFSPETLSTIATKAGFTASRVSTTATNAKTFGRASLLIRNHGSFPRTFRGAIESEIYPLIYLYRGAFEKWKDATSGEECILQATY